MRYIPFLSRGKGIASALFFTLCLFALGFVAAPGLGQTTGGHAGPAFMSVQQALAAQHGAAVSVKGDFTRYLGRDEYTFTDSTGSAEVTIPVRAWMGLGYYGIRRDIRTLPPRVRMGQDTVASNAVELQGEVRKDDGRARIHVHRIVTR